MIDELKKTITANTGNDFIPGLVANKPISTSPVNRTSAWTLYNNYKTLPEGLSKIKIILLMTGMKDAFKHARMEYTFKLFTADSDFKINFYTWDKPL